MSILDAVAGPILLLFPLLFIVFFIGAVLLEGWIIHKIMKRTFRNGFVMALYANGASLLAGVLSIRWIGPPTYFPNYVAYFLVTLLVEFGAILLITKGKELKTVALTVLIINLASYGVLALALLGMGEF